MTVTVGRRHAARGRGRRRALVLPTRAAATSFAGRRTRRERRRPRPRRRRLARLGQPKQLLAFRGATLLDATLATARAAGARPGAWSRSAGRPTQVRARVDLTGVDVGAQPRLRRRLRHLDPAGAGRTCADDAEGVVLLLGDQPGVTVDDDRRRWSPAPAATPSACLRVRRRPRSPVVVRSEHVRDPSPACTATRRSGSWSTPARTWPGSAVAGPGAPRRRHLGRLPGAARGRPDERRPGVAPTTSAAGSTSTTTSPTRASPPRCSSRCGSGCRCCSRASPASARPRPRRCWPRRSTHRWSGCSATRGSTASEALYDWNYQRQLLAIRLAESQHERLARGRPVQRGVPGRAADPALRPVRRADGRRCCSSTRSTGPTTSSRRSCSSSLGEGSVTVPELGTFTADAAADRRAHVQPEPRPARRAAPPLPLPLARVPRAGARASRSCVARCPRRASALIESAAAVRRPRARRSTSTSRPGWRRRSTGSPRSRRSARPSWCARSWSPTLGALAKTPDDRDLVVASLDDYAFG